MACHRLIFFCLLASDQDTWSRTAHVTLLTAAILAAAVTALWAVLNLLNIWQPLVSKLAGSPLKTPTAMGVSIGRTPRSSSGPSTSPGKAHIKQPMFDPGTPRQQGLEGASGSSTNAATRTASAILTAVDTAIRNVVHANVHAMVTLALIAALLLGTAGTATFISLQIANEARGAIAAARDAFPAAWPGVAGPVSLALEPLLPETGIEALGAGPRRLQQVASGVQLPPWLAAYQQDALAMAQRSLPGIVSWLEGQLHGVMKAHNLSDALWDARLMYESAQGPRACSERERSKLLVSLAKAEVALQQAREDEATARRKRDEAWRVLGNATAALDVAMASLSGGSKEAIPSDRRVKQQCSVEDEESCSAPDGARRGRLAELHQQVVAADADGAAAQTEHKAAVAGLDDALHAHKVANGRLQLCSNAAAAGGASRNATDSGLFGELSARLESAYTKLLWRWQFREGLSDLREVVVDAVKGLSRGSARGGAADLSRLHQLAQVAAVPLVTLGRTAASSVGATTAAAVMGSLGLFRLGLGVVHLGVQGALFLTLLYYLLAAKTDPLARAVALLPLPNAARHRAAAAINAALGGVFMSLLKLAALHGMFTWVTYRALRVPLAYTSATASAAFALLPFIPTYSVALPGCAMVALQGRVWTAAAVILLQFAAYYLGDTVVLEDAGGHPFMMSLAILGGLYSFPNPLLGCVLGPIMLSLLSALGTLHQELMGAAPVVATPGREGALRLGVEKAAPGLPVQGDTPRGRVNDSKPVETLQLGPRSVGEGAQEVPEPEDAEAEASLSLGGGHAALEARAEAVDEEEVDSFTFPRRKSGSMRRAT